MKLIARQVETLQNPKRSLINRPMVAVYICWLIPTVKGIGVSNTVH